ncbi:MULTISPECIES: hypothetical protein [Prevotellaceae]|nr:MULTISPECIES: hypothetical protein [Prevotellaceae]SFO59485.1 hypothetical protein SAMN04487852_103112 [Prevotella sp. tf2-5]
MKKKYITPVLDVVKMNAHVSILAGSTINARSEEITDENYYAP